MRHFFVTLVLTVIVQMATFSTYSYAQEEKAKPAEYTNRREITQDENLRTDFAIQGEYLGKLGDKNFGLQLIADGDAKFRFVLYSGGLPGAGWNAGDLRISGKAEYKDGEMTLTIKDNNGKIALNGKGKVTIETPQRGQGAGGQGAGQGAGGGFRGQNVKIELAFGDGEVTFEKTARRSKTLGEKAPEGAIVLFDGANLDMFLEGAKMNEQPARGGAANSQSTNTLWSNATSKPLPKKPYKMHLEFLLSYMPTAQGQARANSGVYLDEAYECQVLDSFGLEGANNECGGFYQVAKPIVNICFPPMMWQTYDIDFTPASYDADGKKTVDARATVLHNGVKIHDDIVFKQETPGRKKEGAEPRGVYFQGHGNKIQFRNIWVKEL